MISAEVLRALVDAGATAEMIVAAVAADNAAADARKVAARAKNAERQRRHRNALSRVTGVSNGDGEGQKEIPPKPPKEKLPPLNQSEANASSLIGEPPSKAKRAARLPAGWEPSARNLADADAAGLTPAETQHEAAKFRDWAHGKGEAKADWDATWRNWCRRVVERQGTGPPSLRLVNAPLLDANGNEIHDEPRGRRSDGKGRFTDTFDATLLALERASGR